MSLKIINLSLGGNFLLMPISGREVLFEMHSYFGPIPLNKRTHDSLARIPKGFWDAFERWDVGGKVVEGEKCVLQEWCPKCKGSGDETKHIGGKHYEVTGLCNSCQGERLEVEVQR